MVAEICSEYCRYSRHCFNFAKQTADNDPDHCGEYIKLEKIAYDCEHDREEIPFYDDEIDEDVEEDDEF